MTQHNSFSLFFQPSQIVENLHVYYVIYIVFMYLFIICSSCSLFIAIRNLKLYTYIIAILTYVQDIVEIIYCTYIYIIALNPRLTGAP